MTLGALVALVAVCLLAGCAETPSPPDLTLDRVSYSDLREWQNDRQSQAVPALERSCAVLTRKPPSTALGVAGTAQDWMQPCAALQASRPMTDAQARAFFERWFTPYAVNRGTKGLFTGYYEARLNGSWQRGGAYQTPLWQRPADLVRVDLGDFKAGLKGQRIVGKVVAGTLKPYDSRESIAAGALSSERAKPLLWVDNPIDAFFLEIQGSGIVTMTDGQTVRVGYDAQNGHDYVAIGRVLADQGSIDKPVTMAKIRAWLQSHPDEAQTIMNRNPSVVFFRQLEGEGPLGAQGVALTRQRSLAIDRAFLPLGVPLWIEIDQDAQGIAPPPSLVVAQDTGGAIKGPVRGDFFWGSGPEAEARAGALQNQGTYYVLLP